MGLLGLVCLASSVDRVVCSHVGPLRHRRVVTESLGSCKTGRVLWEEISAEAGPFVGNDVGPLPTALAFQQVYVLTLDMGHGALDVADCEKPWASIRH